MCNRQHLEGKTAEFVFIFVTNLQFKYTCSISPKLTVYVSTWLTYHCIYVFIDSCVAYHIENSQDSFMVSLVTGGSHYHHVPTCQYERPSQLRKRNSLQDMLLNLINIIK